MGDDASSGAIGVMTKLGILLPHDLLLPHENRVLKMLAITDYWVYYVF